MAGVRDSYPIIISESEGCYDEYSSVSEFEENLMNDYLLSQKAREGWAFWSDPAIEVNSINGSNVSGKTIGEKIILALLKMKSTEREDEWFRLVQFWVPRQIGGRCYLTTCGQPFAVKYLYKGICSYRKISTQHMYVVDDEAKEEELGPPGRVFRSGHPESSPDLLFYSTQEFPLRDYAASCGLLTYLAVPVFDLNHEQCVGVLEHLHFLETVNYPFPVFPIMYDALEIAEMRSTHKFLYENLKYQPRQPHEIKKMLDFVTKAIPQLHFAQVWTHCRQCANISNNFYCMEPVVYACGRYLECNRFHNGCRFHKNQNGKGVVGLAFSSTNKALFCRNMCDFSISEYPMAHYAQQARFSLCFAICLENIDDHYVFEFFLQPQSRDDAYIRSLLHLLLHVMEMNLISLKISTGQNLGEELVVHEMLPTKSMPTFFETVQKFTLSFRNENQQSKLNTMVMPMKGYSGKYSLSQFKDYFHNTDLSCIKTQMRYEYGLIGWSIRGKELSENRANSSSTLTLSQIQEKIKSLFGKLLKSLGYNDYILIQFWAPKMIGNMSFLSTSEQPFALGYLYKGLCWYRKKCMEHPYCVGNGKKVDNLGPAGRVFLNGYLESSPDLRLYSTNEFPLRDHISNVNTKAYLAVPLFDSHNEQCLGVLEFVGHPFYGKSIAKLLEAANLRSIPVDYSSCFQPIHLPNPNIAGGQQLAFIEINEMLEVVIKSPQIVVASVWIPCKRSDDINIELSSLELSKLSVNLLKKDKSTSAFIKAYKSLHVRPRKGFMGRVLASEYKMCFCDNFCDFSIVEEPLAHYAQVAGLGHWFAICLQSAHTGSNLYVLEFILSPVSTKYKYPQSFLSSLLSLMKNKLKSFMVASGEELGRKLIFQATGFGTENEFSYSETFQLGSLPVRNETAQGECEIQKYYSEMHFNGVDDDGNVYLEQEHDTTDGSIAEEQEQSITDANSEEGRASSKCNRDGSNTGLHVSYEVLKSKFGKKLKDVAEELGVGRSTLKRKCREYGINRWPSNAKNKKNPFLFQTALQVQDSHLQISKHSSSYLPITSAHFPMVQPNAPHTSIESTREVDKTCQKTNMVMIKAKFEDDTIKFMMRLSLGMERLAEEVGKRLNLMIGSFKLKYMDEDENELILLTCDEDLNLFVESMRSLGKTTVQVIVHSISD